MLIYLQAPKQLLLFALVIQTYLLPYQPPKLGENMIVQSAIYIKTSTLKSLNGLGNPVTVKPFFVAMTNLSWRNESSPKVGRK